MTAARTASGISPHMLMILRQIRNVRESRRARFYAAIPTLTALKRRGLIGWDNSHRWLKLDNFVSLTNAGREALQASAGVGTNPARVLPENAVGAAETPKDEVKAERPPTSPE